MICGAMAHHLLRSSGGAVTQGVYIERQALRTYLPRCPSIDRAHRADHSSRHDQIYELMLQDNG